MSDADRIERNTQKYMGDRKPTSRYASFDYCFNYFQAHREAGQLDALADGPGLQLSCLQLGFYLASWGMLRGGELRSRSMRAFAPVVKLIAETPGEIWCIDADRYSEETTRTALLGFAEDVRRSLDHGATDTLVTKIMLGTTGCVPAFDRFFRRGFGVATLCDAALRKIGGFYRDNTNSIEAHRKHTLDFDTELSTPRRYTRAKVIDMVFFIEGLERTR
jgi:hypothetical protein